MNKNVEKWSKYYRDIGLSPEVSDRNVAYVTPLLERNLPPIFDLEHLSLLLGREGWHLSSMINATDRHYRNFKLPKRRGGHRIISAPYPSLLGCQRWILQNILEKLRIHNNVYSYTKRKTIIDNAKQHVGKLELVKIDLQDFFPNIKFGRVYRLYKSLGYNDKVSFYLARLSCLGGRLPQGAATSPCLSNIICNKMDKRITGFLQRRGLKYTRYADDITISGKNIIFHDLRAVFSIIEDEGFKVNFDKFVFQKGSGKKIVTGIDISNNIIRVPREYRRKIRQEMHYITKYGILSHTKKERIKNPFYVESLRGKIMFWRQVEEDNEEPIKNLKVLEKYK